MPETRRHAADPAAVPAVAHAAAHAAGPVALSSEPLLRLDGVAMQYGKGEASVTALSGIDLQVAAGELVAVMGASGSGKSTLLTIAGGLTVPTSGEVVVAGTHLSTLSAKRLAQLRRRTLGFVFQDFNLVPSLTALENVTLPLDLDGWPRRKAHRAGRLALGMVELDDRSDAHPDDLSGGQQQRVAIARALVGDRTLILADEPTGALDSTTGDVVMRMLRRRIDAGAGGILVTHDSRHAAWADRVVFLRDGRIADSSRRDRPDDLLAAGGQGSGGSLACAPGGSSGPVAGGTAAEGREA